jgi:hypothetical protein
MALKINSQSIKSLLRRVAHELEMSSVAVKRPYGSFKNEFTINDELGS